MSGPISGLNNAAEALGKIGDTIADIADLAEEQPEGVKNLVKALKKGKAPAWALLAQESPRALRVIADKLKGGR